MGDGGRKSGRDMILEGRHLLLLFLTVVVLCGVFFTLGYVTGAAHRDGTVVAAASPAAQPPAESATAPNKEKSAAEPPQPSDWNFYRSGEPKRASDERLATRRSTPTASKPAARGTTTKSSALKPPQFAKGAIVLQVAALTRETDALGLATTLQQKEFPAFVLSPTSDKYFRVQVGPYADAQSADYAKRALEREGFKAIVRR